MIVLIIIIVAVAAAALALYSARVSQNTSESTSSTTSASTSSSASSSTSTAIATTATRDTLVIDDALWPAADLNQLYSVSLTSWPDWLEYTVYQSLVTVNETAEYQQGNVIYLPMLATSWNVSSDGETYTFDLRRNVTFSNGDPFNAYQVWMQMYAFYYLSANSSNWLESYDLFNFSNVNFGPPTIQAINGSGGGLISPSQQALAIMMNRSWPIYVTGAYQLVFHLQFPFAWFLGTLVAFDGLVFDSQYVLDHGGFGTPSAFNSYFNQNPIPGTGPYVVAQVAENDYVRFAQNPTYWGNSLSQSEIAGDPILDSGHARNVVVYYKPDDVDRYTDLATGAAQIAAIQTPDWNLVLTNPAKYSYLTVPSWAGLINTIGINTKIYPTNITSVRQAIVHAINYTDISKKAYLGDLSPYFGPEYPAWKNFYDLGNFTNYTYNLTLAEKLLSQSHIQNMPALTIIVPSSCSYCVTIAETMQSDLSQLNIILNVDVIQSSNFYASYGSYSAEVGNPEQIGHFSLLAINWAPNAVTPADYWVTFVSNQSLYGNSAIYYNPTVQAAVNALTSSQNVTYIQSLVRQAQAQIYNDAPYIWLGVSGLSYSGGSLVWQKSAVRGFYADPLWTGQNTAPLFNTVTFY